MSDLEDFFEELGTQVEARRARNSDGVPLGSAPSATGTLETGVARRWASNGDLFWGASQTYDSLPPGLYRCGSAEGIGFTLSKSLVDTDDLIELPDSASSQVIAEIQTFWGLESEFKKRGFIHKRGVLLYGPPGSGKTATLNQLIALIIGEYKGVGLFVDHPGLASGCLQMVRRVERGRPVVALLEDIDALVERYGENEYLAMLDGEAQVSNIVFVATTNYPERLDRRFVDRPSRFDAVRYIGMPNAAARRVYLLAKEPSLIESGEVEKWVRESDGLSIAHLREMIILCRCYKKPLSEAIERLSAMRQKPNSEHYDDRKGAGFKV